MSLYSDLTAHKKPKLLLALAFGVFIASVGTFASLADEVREGGTLSFDNAVLLAINAQSSPLLDTVFVIGTNLGGVFVVAFTTAFLIAMLVLKRQYSKALLTAIIIGGTTLANLFLKLFFERSRPELWERLVVEQSFSFPSGHAMASMALGLTIILLTWNTRWRVLALVMSILYIFFIAASRLYLGVHYPTDILAGWIVSSLWVAGVTSILYRKNIVATYNNGAV